MAPDRSANGRILLEESLLSGSVANLWRRHERRRPRKSLDPPSTRNPGNLERNTGFEPATFALARRTDRVTSPPCSSPTVTNAWKSFGATRTGGEAGSPTLPDGPQPFCSTG